MCSENTDWYVAVSASTSRSRDSILAEQFYRRLGTIQFASLNRTLMSPELESSLDLLLEHSPWIMLSARCAQPRYVLRAVASDRILCRVCIIKVLKAVQESTSVGCGVDLVTKFERGGGDGSIGR